VDTGRLGRGLTYAYYERRVRRAAALSEWVPSARDVVSGLDFTGSERAEDFGVRWQGLLRVPADGVYEFALESDDGSVLRIGGNTVIDHDGPHGARTAMGAVALAAGHHRFELLYFQGEGDRTLGLRMRSDRTEGWVPIPPDWFYREP
jgi:hexosaminidase